MKAIQTKYIGPTDYKGSRVKATAEGWGSVTISYPSEYNTERAHYEAALALVDKVNKESANGTIVDPPTISGAIGSGYVFCYENSKVQP